MALLYDQVIILIKIVIKKFVLPLAKVCIIRLEAFLGAHFHILRDSSLYLSEVHMLHAVGWIEPGLAHQEFC